MATRKVKHAIAVAKHNDFMESVRQSGLAALRGDRANRERENLQKWEEIHIRNHRGLNDFVSECPWCISIKRALAQGAVNA